MYQSLQFLPLNRRHEEGHTTNIQNSVEKSESDFFVFCPIRTHLVSPPNPGPAKPHGACLMRCQFEKNLKNIHLRSGHSSTVTVASAKFSFSPAFHWKRRWRRLEIKTDTRERHLKDSGNIFERRLAQWLVFVWQTRGVQGRELDFLKFKLYIIV